MNNSNLLNIFLPKEQIEKSFPFLDADIPLPVQMDEGVSEKEFDVKTLTAEMILAGLLLVFAYDRKNIHIEYYRKIFNLLRPKIRAEMTDAAIIKTRNGDYDNAEEILLALEGLNPDDGITKLNLALLMEERSDFFEEAELFDEANLYTAKAENLYNVLISFEPAIPAAFFNAGYFFAKKKQYAKVKSLLSTYIKIETENTETAKIRLQKAEEFVNLITAQALDDELFANAHNLINLGKDEDACQEIKKFLQKNPKVWNAWFLLGWALRRLERWEDAKASFLQAITLLEQLKEKEAYFADVFNELAICEMESENYSEAESCLLEALGYEPENIKVISNLGTLALKQGRREEAEAFFRTVLVINPEDKLAKQILNFD